MWKCFGCHSSHAKAAKDKSKDVDETSMFSAVEGDRNSFTSFLSIEVDEAETRLFETISLGHNNLSVLKSLIESKMGFRANGSMGNTQLWYSPRTSTGMPMIALGETTISGSIPLSLISATIMNLETKAEWDPEFSRGRQIGDLHQAPEGVSVRRCWVACKAKPGIAGRDFVYNAVSQRVGDEAWTVVTWTVDIDECPLEFLPKVESADHVRGKVVLAGFHVRKTGSDWTVTYLSQVEVGLPGWLTDPVLRKAPSLLNGLRAKIEHMYSLSS